MTTLSLHPESSAQRRAEHALHDALDTLRAYAFLSDTDRAGAVGLHLVTAAVAHLQLVAKFVETP